MSTAIAEDAMRPLFRPVVDAWDETDDTFNIEVEMPARWEFQPGQFNMLYAFGIGEAPISISGTIPATDRIIHTIREVGAVTGALHRLRPGDQVGVRGPFGTGWPVQAAEGHDVVIVAGGIGLAPLRPVMLHVLGHRDRYQRVALLYGARSPGDLLFDEQLAEWRSRFDLEVEVTVDSATRRWRGPVGVVTRLIERVEFDPDGTTAMVCGPEVMMRFSARALLDAGVPAGNVYLSTERNMQCGIGLCGHCQLGPYFTCKAGPVLSFAQLEPLMSVPEV